MNNYTITSLLLSSLARAPFEQRCATISEMKQTLGPPPAINGRYAIHNGSAPVIFYLSTLCIANTQVCQAPKYSSHDDFNNVLCQLYWNRPCRSYHRHRRRRRRARQERLSSTSMLLHLPLRRIQLRSRSGIDIIKKQFSERNTRE